MTRHANNREPSTENTVHSPSSFEENFATAIRQTAAHIHEALTKSAKDIKKELDLTK